MFSNITTNFGSNTFVQLFTGHSKYLPKVLKRFNRSIYRSAGCLAKINVLNDDKYVVLSCDESKSLKYPIVWLRDNCQCKECFHDGSMSRIIDWSKFNVNVKIDNISVSNLSFTPSLYHRGPVYLAISIYIISVVDKITFTSTHSSISSRK